MIGDLPIVRRQGSARPVYFIGDSSTLIYRNRLYRKEDSPETYLGRSIYLPGIHAADMCSSTGVIHPQILATLSLENLLVTDLSGQWRGFHEDISIVTKLLASVMGFGNNLPPIVFSMGGFDAMRLFEEFGEGAFEIELPEFLPQIGGAPVAGVPHYTFEKALATAKRYVEPYGRALAQIKSYGLTNLFVHDLPPLGIDDGAFGRYYSTYSTKRSRYAVAIVFNYLLRVMCEYVGITYIDLWPHVVTKDGYREPRYSRDPIHLNGRAALLTLGFVLGRGKIETREVDADDLESETFPAVLGAPTDDYDFAAIARPDFEPLTSVTLSTG